MDLHFVLGRTPLHRAVENGKVAVVEYLVQNGADINIVDHWIHIVFLIELH